MLGGARPRRPGRCSALALAWFLVASPLRAEPDACSLRATLSPCFDADPVWLAAGQARFQTLPSPHPDGRVVPVLDVTSTLTLAARYGLGRGIDLQAALPLVPYQDGTGAEGVTSQRARRVRSSTLRDPRLGFSTTIAGRKPDAPLVLGTRLELALPLGDAGALAGAAGPTIAPAAAAEMTFGRVAVGLDLGVRLRRAVSFASVREGSELVTALGASVALLEKPVLELGLEAFLRGPLASAPPGSGGDRNLPAEWLANARFRPAADAPWSVELGAGSGLPLSRARPDRDAASTFGVTAPRFRASAAFRYALAP